MIRSFINSHNIEYYENCNLKRYNTYRLETICKYLVIPKDKEELRELLKYLNINSIKHIVIGGGSNIIFKDDYYDGIVISLSNLNKKEINNNIIEVEAGYSLQKLALEVCNLGLSGLEFACGIPGLVGASVAMNAGAYNSAMEEIVEEVEVIDENFEFRVLLKEDLGFSYRDSIFKKDKRYIIVSTKLKVVDGDKEEILEKINKRRIKRMETQPLNMPSAGSVFRNPPNMHSGALIEEIGLKGYSINGAGVSSKHANFIVNLGNAKGRDIVCLIEKIQKEVKEKYNVDLILEQIIVD